ncbi:MULTISPECIES: hypothetical protein [Corallococcus]|uniref:hypothetical protein n=1 Tax=Corallococcus TaxID=83461 RepID=UPI00117D3EFA|nr:MULTISPECIES: hypothetical protein [Corallococcus]NBD11595.1 hypothetical protein [Corallococcus silvisoli]TSC32208.1 hypothetical protein FOF48_09170 [Corallococcus sp. Z5C101001]
MIIFGSRLYGKVDEVPGLGYVATKFGHLYYVPLLPLEGWLVVGEDGNGWRGQAIPMSGKSVLVAWARVVFLFVGLGALFGGLTMLSGQVSGLTISLALVSVLCIAGLIASYTWRPFTHASPERALEIAAQAGISEEGLEQLRRMYASPVASMAAAPAQRWTPPES